MTTFHLVLQPKIIKENSLCLTLHQWGLIQLRHIFLTMMTGSLLTDPLWKVYLNDMKVLEAISLLKSLLLRHVNGVTIMQKGIRGEL